MVIERQAPLTLFIWGMLSLLVPCKVMIEAKLPNRFANLPVSSNAIRRDGQCCCISHETTTTSFKRRVFALSNIRGGETLLEEDNDEDEDDDVEDVVSSDGAELDATTSNDEIIDIPKRILITISRLTLALSRAIHAAFQSDEAGSEKGSLTSSLWNILQRMYKAAITNDATEASTSKKDDAVDNASMRSSAASSKKKQDIILESIASNPHSDFGSYLSDAYEVVDARKQRDRTQSFLGGTLADALQTARSQARLLVVFIPASQPPTHKTRTKPTTTDQEAIQSLLSKEVVAMAKKKARKNESFGSFIFWGAKAGSSEAVAALKLLKAKQTSGKGGKRPVLIVAYPKQVVSSVGEPKLVPLLVAQHHCSPPPSAKSMAAWLNALRKRHAKEYITMQRDMREARLFRERQEGYRESMTMDAERQEKERKMEAERIAREVAEQERLEAIKQRRKELLSSLPDEPTDGNAVVIALRFTDGRTGQRRFAPDTPLETLFNWVDALYDMERETFTLTTMNGQKSFSWQDCKKQSLTEAGIGRMTGLRVLQTKSDGASAPQQPASATS